MQGKSIQASIRAFNVHKQTAKYVIHRHVYNVTGIIQFIKELAYPLVQHPLFYKL